MRPVERGDVPVDPETQEPMTFSDYKQAAPHLKNRLGDFCSYCERHIPVGLAVEHKWPKSGYPARAKDWHNFLLACQNCNSHKAAKTGLPVDALWPDEHDTYRALRYREDGAITPHNARSDAAALLDLVGLNKTKLTSTHTDLRWKNRQLAWDKARLAKTLMATAANAHALAIATVTGHGHWSIWMTVFADDPDMQQRLIAAFPGTAKARLGYGADTAL